MDLLDLKTIEEVMAKFVLGGCEKSPLIVRAGNIFLESKGKNLQAENFLRSFLLGKKDSERLTAAIDHLTGDKREALKNEIKENCFCFLAVWWPVLQIETQLTLGGIISNPTYPNFCQNTNQKMMELCRKKTQK